LNQALGIELTLLRGQRWDELPRCDLEGTARATHRSFGPAAVRDIEQNFHE
jgi:hypothetical protein